MNVTLFNRVKCCVCESSFTQFLTSSTRLSSGNVPQRQFEKRFLFSRTEPIFQLTKSVHVGFEVCVKYTRTFSTPYLNLAFC
ncbi:hypothetical protein TNCV_3948291 [Trichonephila clavipes]|nr:hypothetical protein TNCV_3948291 [Trichonephila clavipes]